MPYDRFVAEILTASGSQETNPPTVWYRTVRTTPDYVESVAQAFLGVRIQCAQCHHHPAERWSQADYYQPGGRLRPRRPQGRLRRRRGADRRNDLSGRRGRSRPSAHRAGDAAAARWAGRTSSSSRYDDPRRSLARWMTGPDNPYFARTMANRMWGHFFGRGIIHPIDDARSTNPPSNPELLDALARDFVASGYDVKHLIRVICNSAAYGLSSVPNETNQDDMQSFARYYPRRLSAEVLLDAIGQVLEAPTKFSSVAGEFPAGRGPSTCRTRRCPAISWTCSAGPPATRPANANGSTRRPGSDAGTGQLRRDPGEADGRQGLCGTAGGQRQAARRQRPATSSCASSPARREPRSWQPP